MIWFTQWITLYGEHTLKFSAMHSHFLLSLYSIGSILGVLVLFRALDKGVAETKIMVIMNAIALVALLGTVLLNNVLLIELSSFLFGFSTASGVMQTALTAFMKLYPTRRGFVTGIFYFFGSIASFTVPIITGKLSTNSIALAFTCDLLIGATAFILALMLNFLSKRSTK